VTPSNQSFQLKKVIDKEKEKKHLYCLLKFTIEILKNFVLPILIKDPICKNHLISGEFLMIL
jgi:hypothetical protein